MVLERRTDGYQLGLTLGYDGGARLQRYALGRSYNQPAADKVCAVRYR